MAVGLDRVFHKLSKYMKFIKFGLANLILLNFEQASVSNFDLNPIIRIWKVGPAREKNNGPAQLSAAAGLNGPRMSVGFLHTEAVRILGPLD
jgi:hypothetical protein